MTRITDLETAWDDAQPTLEPLDETAWTFLDSEIDDVLSAVRAGNPDTGSRARSTDRAEHLARRMSTAAYPTPAPMTATRRAAYGAGRWASRPKAERC